MSGSRPPSAGRADGPTPHASVGNNPVNVVDPSGRGGVGLRGVWVDAGGHLRGGGGGTSNPLASWLNKCGIDVALYVITLALAIIGINAHYQGLRAVAYALVSWFGPDLFGVFGTAFARDTVGLIISIAQLLFDIVTWLWQNVIIKLIRGFFAWVRVTFNLSNSFVPGVLPIKAGIFAFSAGLGFASLVVSGCVFG